MNKKDIIEKGLIAAKGITAMIPVLGGTLTSVWSDIEAVQAKRKFDRLEDFYINLKEELEEVKNQLEVSYISKPDFLDIFELTARYIVNERTEEKRVLFRNIFLNSLIKKDCSYDKTEKYLRILEQMNSLDLLLLRIFSNPARYNEQQGEIIKDPNWIRPGVRNMVQFSMVYEVSKMLCDLIKVPQDDISESLYFLEGNRLLAEKTGSYRVQTNGHPIHTLEDKLTSKGKDFIAFILR